MPRRRTKCWPAAKLDVPLAPHLVAHVDASYTHNDDLDTGSFILSKPLREQAAASADPDIRALADLRGELPNSDGRTFEAAGALAYVDGDTNVGFSVARHTAFYGVPVRYSLDPAIEAERTHIDVAADALRRPRRVRPRRPVQPAQVARRLVRLPSRRGRRGRRGRQFGVLQGGEVRADLVQQELDGWGGQSGVQLLDVRQHIDGDEQYLPPVRNESLGLFSVQHFHRGRLRLEAGGRFERTDLSADASAIVGNPDLDVHFRRFSASLGGSYEVAAGWRVGLNLARSARAPSAEELFANGPHAGNASFELGDPDLRPRRASASRRRSATCGDGFNLSATAYGSHFSNFLYQAPTGEVRDDLPVYAFREGSANYSGFEVQADADLGEAAGLNWGIEGQADATWVHH